MKSYVKVLFFIILVFYSERAFSQPSRDSLLAKYVRNIKKSFLLSDSAATAILKIGKKQIYQSDSLSKVTQLKVDDKRKGLVKIQKEFHDNLKKILNADQWNRFMELENAQRKKFKQSIKDKKIEVIELA
jgi:hypothetical protein